MRKALFHFLYHLSPPSVPPNNPFSIHTGNKLIFFQWKSSSDFSSHLFTSEKPDSLHGCPRSYPCLSTHPPLSPLGRMLTEKPHAFSSSCLLQSLQNAFSFRPASFSPKTFSWLSCFGSLPMKLLFSLPGTHLP